MQLTEVIRGRRMCRDFDPERPVERRVVERLLRLALRAPSAGFSQGTSFVVLDTPEDRSAFWAAASARSGRSEGGRRPDAWLRGVSAAPVLAAVLADPSRYERRYALPDKSHPDSDPARWPTPFWHVDAGMAIMSFLLAAEDEGLGALFFGVPEAAIHQVRGLLDVPAPAQVVGMLALGHRREIAGAPAPRGRSSARPAREPFERHVRFGLGGPDAATVEAGTETRPETARRGAVEP